MDTKKIGAFIASCRKAKGYTQQQLAEKLGVTNKTVSRSEFPKQKDIKKQPVFTCLQTKEYCY